MTKEEKTMDCIICRFSSTQFDLNRKRHVATKHPDDAKGLICSKCIQVILASTQEQIKGAHQKALSLGLLDKGKALEGFIKGVKENVTETTEVRSDMVRKRPVRAARSFRNRQRA